jgi:hypothetical protein
MKGINLKHIKFEPIEINKEIKNINIEDIKIYKKKKRYKPKPKRIKQDIDLSQEPFSIIIEV